MQFLQSWFTARMSQPETQISFPNFACPEHPQKVQIGAECSMMFSYRQTRNTLSRTSHDVIRTGKEFIGRKHEGYCLTSGKWFWKGLGRGLLSQTIFYRKRARKGIDFGVGSHSEGHMGVKLKSSALQWKSSWYTFILELKRVGEEIQLHL